MPFLDHGQTRRVFTDQQNMMFHQLKFRNTLNPKKSWTDAFPGKYPIASSPVSNALIDASIPGNNPAYSIKGWIVNATNLISSIPNQANTLKAIQNLDLLVSIDTMPMEITGWADVVLPECTYLERYDVLRVSPHRKPALALRMPPQNR